MAYCTKCGTKNDDDAAFCKKCGLNLAGTQAPSAHASPDHHDHGGKREDECEEACHGSGEYSWFWGAIVILIGIGLIIEFGLKNLDGMPDWIHDVSIWWMIPVLIGLLIIMAGINAMTRSKR